MRCALAILLLAGACTSAQPGGRPAGEGGAGGSGGSAPCPDLDLDRDGFVAAECGGPDCADLDPTVHPGASEVCGDDGDQDCDGDPDSGCTCAPGDMRACWGGNAGERGVGMCRDGGERCGLDGRWGACQGEVRPADDLACNGFDEDCNPGTPVCTCPGAVEICGNGLDDDCDGVRDDPDFCPASCLLPPGEETPWQLRCCEDPASSRYAFACVDAPYLPACAARSCVDLDGDAATTCVAHCLGDQCWCGAPGPDGVPVESKDCGYETPCNRLGCELRQRQPCYTGLPSTLGLGTCHGGFADCAEADGVRTWGACTGEALPGTETCGNDIDDDCDGRIDEEDGATGRPCPVDRECGEEVCGNGDDDDCDGFADEGCPADGSLQACWTGPPQRRSVGDCRDGTQRSDGAWLPCQREVLPAAEICGDGIDGDCDGKGGAFEDEEPGCCVATGEETCNGADDDCDGLVDEGVRSWCGTCEACPETVVIEDLGTCSAPLRTCERIRDAGGATVDLDAEVERCDPGILLFTNSRTAGITRFDPATGTLAEWLVPEAPVTMACDGTFWRQGSSKVTHFDAAGQELCSIDRKGEAPVAVDERGDAWVLVSDGFNNFELLAFHGDCAAIELSPDEPNTPGIHVPEGAPVMSARDRLWIAADPPRQVNLRTLDVTTAQAAPFPAGSPRADRDGNLWFASPLTRVPASAEGTPDQWRAVNSSQWVRSWHDRVWAITDLQPSVVDPRTGDVTPMGLPDGYNRAWDPVVDLDGNVWQLIYFAPGLQPQAFGRYDGATGLWTTLAIVPYASSDSDASVRSAAELQAFKRHRARWAQDIDAASLTVHWDRVRWDAEVPAGASLDVEARFAVKRLHLDQASPCVLKESPADLSRCAGAQGSRWMRIEAHLVNGWDAAPVLKRVEIDRAQH